MFYLQRLFSAIPYQEHIEIKHSNLCWLSILFYFLGFRSLIFYIIYITDVIYGYNHKSWNFMNSNCCLQKHWGEKPWKFILSIFVMTSLWYKIFEIALKCSFYQVFGHILWKFGVHYAFWRKIVVPQIQNFFFPLYLFHFLHFWKTADVSIFSFSD